MLKDSIMAPQAEIKDNMIKLVQKLFLENDKLFHNWNNDNHQELLKYISQSEMIIFATQIHTKVSFQAHYILENTRALYPIA